MQSISKDVVLIGAGFQMSLLDPALSSSKSIIQDHANSKNLPILNFLNKNNHEELDLYAIWNTSHKVTAINRSIYKYITKVDLQKILFEYPDRKVANIADYYLATSLRFSSHPEKLGQLAFILTGIELKKLLTIAYSSKIKVNFRQETISKYINVNDDLSWISLNYDLILESVLQSQGKKWHYPYNEFLTDPVATSESPNEIIKPHGSLNVCFNTRRYSPCCILNDIFYVNNNNLLETLPMESFGYTSAETPFTEQRPCLIGYVDDQFKPELQEKEDSDEAHLYLQTYAKLSRERIINAKSLFIWGYSLPPADEWVSKSFRDILNKEIPVDIASGTDSECIFKFFKQIGFVNVKVIGDKGFI